MSRTQGSDASSYVGVVKTEDGVVGYYHKDYPQTGNLPTHPGAVVKVSELSDITTFNTGATRSDDTTRIDPEGFLSPIAVDRYCEYLHKHRFQADGSVRASDNWQRGMPLDRYVKSLWRHLLHLWQRHRGWGVTDPRAGVDIEEDLCAIMFNAQGMLHEILKERCNAKCIKF